MNDEIDVDRKTLLKVLAAYWLAFLFVYYLQDWNFQLATLVRRVLVALIGVGLCWAMYRILRRADPRTTSSRLTWVLGLSVPFDFLFAFVSFGAVYLQHSGSQCATGRDCAAASFLVPAVNYSASFLFLFIAWGSTYLGLRAGAEALAAERRAGSARDEARLAELRALRYQVNPHFLFNTLNSLGTLVDRGDNAGARGMIGEMSSFLRYGLAVDPLADVELDDEVEMQRRYLEIERLRFAHRLAIVIDVDPSVRNARIPSLLLQPLVENAVKHGVASTSAPVTVSLRAAQADTARMTVIVEDDAPIVRSETGPRMGIGLRNVSERLRARFGQDASLTVGPRPGGGYRAEIVMPLVRS